MVCFVHHKGTFSAAICLAGINNSDVGILGKVSLKKLIDMFLSLTDGWNDLWSSKTYVQHNIIHFLFQTWLSIFSRSMDFKVFFFLLISRYFYMPCSWRTCNGMTVVCSQIFQILLNHCMFIITVGIRIPDKFGIWMVHLS